MPHGPWRRPRRLVLAVVLLPGLLLLGAGPAHAQAVTCGSVVTENLTLQGDLVDCPGNGLVIGAPDITVDLNGHTISGLALQGVPGVGIDNSAGYDDVTIRNGTVNRFYNGFVHLAGADRNRVLDLDGFLSHEYGILVEGGSGNRLAGNSLDVPGEIGIDVHGAAAAPIRGNLVLGNTVTGHGRSGILLRHGTITGTVVEDNEVTGGVGTDAGVALTARYEPDQADIRQTVVRGNRLDGDYGGGVFVGDQARDTLVEQNQADNILGLPAFESDGDRTTIRRNTVRSTAFPASTNFGIKVDEGAEDNRVELNTITGAGGISVEDSGTRTLVSANAMDGQVVSDGSFGGFIAGIIAREEATDGRITANLVRRHGASSEGGGGIVVAGDRFTVAGNLVSQIQFNDAIRVEVSASGTRLVANVATRSADDGIDVDSPATTVTANVAGDNADLGIEAVGGVTDGGGNRASGNGNPAQCVGVACS